MCGLGGRRANGRNEARSARSLEGMGLGRHGGQSDRRRQGYREVLLGDTSKSLQMTPGKTAVKAKLYVSIAAT